MSLDLDKSTWRRVKFGDVVRNVNNTTKDPESLGIDRVIAMEHMDPGELGIERWGDVADGTTFTRVVTPGQTLFGKRRAYQRKVAYAEFYAICSGDIYTFEAVEGELVPELLPFLVQSEGFFDHALGTSAGSLSPRTNWRDLADFEFDLPPVHEQERLAGLLWAVENHRKALDRLHACLVARRAESNGVEGVALSALATAGAGTPTRVDKMGEVLLGRRRAPQYTGELIPYVRVANLRDNELQLEELYEMPFTPAEQVKYALKPGDILVTEGQVTALVGESAMVPALDRPTCFQSSLHRFRADESVVLPGYAQALFRAALRAGIFSRHAIQTTSIAHLTRDRFVKVELPVPALSEQEERLAKLSTIQSAGADVGRERIAVRELARSIASGIFSSGRSRSAQPSER